MAQPTQIAVVEPKLATGGKLQPIVPQSWNEAVQMAGAFVRAGMVPAHFKDSPEKATVAILAGLEVGLTPMAALQSIAVINNMPTIFGDGMLALVRASGLLEDIEENVEWQKEQPVAATCRVKRKGEKTWGTHTFTVDDANKGGLLGKPGPWKQYPQRMLQMRARAWALRDKFADVLRGMQSREEVEDMVDVTPQGQASVAPPEPKRADYVAPQDQPSSPGASPHSDSVKGQPGEKAAEAPTATPGQPAEPEKPAPETATNKADLVEDPEVTDVEDLNEKPKLEFQEYKRVGDFFVFSDAWLQDPKRTADEAKQWEAFYRDYIKEKANSKNDAIKAAVADTLGIYSGVLAKEMQREPGQEG